MKVLAVPETQGPRYARHSDRLAVDLTIAPVLPEHLPRNAKEYLPTSDACPFWGGGQRYLGEDMAEQLKYLPSSFRVINQAHLKLPCH